MKFERISLEKYGAIAARDIDLVDQNGLIIIYGPNEAGKSTLLSAIGDLLYGIPERSPHGSIFGNPVMLIGATLRLADGTSLVLRRKKGRGPGTLVDETGAPVAGPRMEAVLSGTDRNRFSALFGLDHNSLREGGQKLLAADGEIGQLIVEAGGGLRALVSALSDLESEADQLFSATRSAKRQFYPALDAFQAADKAAKQATMSREAFVKAQNAATAADQALSALREKQAAAREATSRLARLLRVAPQLQQLANAESALGALVDIDELPDALAIDIPRALDGLQTNAKARANAQHALDKLLAQLETLTVDGKIVQAASEIEAAETLALHVEKARLDLPNRRTELAESQSQLGRLRSILGLGAHDDLESRAPLRGDVDLVLSLAADASTLQSSLEAANERLAECRQTLTGVETRQRERETRGFDKPAPVSAVDLSRLPPLAREIETSRRRTVTLRSAAEARAVSLGLGSLTDQKHSLWPTLAEVQAVLERRVATDAEMRQAESVLAAGRRRAEQALARKARLAAGSEPPTPEAVTDARRARDEAWRDIRVRYLDSSDEGWSRPTSVERHEHTTRLESTRDAADQLVDRRGAEAQRIADIASAEREHEEAEEEIARAGNLITDIQKRREDDRLAWCGTWPAVAAIESDLQRLAVLTAERDRLVQDIAELEAIEAALCANEDEAAPLYELLGQAETLLTTDETGALATRVQRAVAALKAHDDQYGDYRRDADEITKLKAQAALRLREVENLSVRQSSWSTAWTHAVSKLGLAADASPQRATEVATEWVGATGVFDAIRITGKRIERITEDDQRLQTIIAELGKRLGLALPEDAVAAARDLNRMLKESNGRALQHEALRPQVEAARVSLQAAAANEQESAESVALLSTRCACDVAALEPLAKRIAARSALRTQVDTLRQAIVTNGDGHSVETLREQWSHEDPDSLVSQLAGLEDNIAEREKEIEAAIIAKRNADTEVTSFLDDDRLNSLIATREAASTEMHRVIERYVELTLAQALLNAGIEKVRHQQQDPLLAQASKYFSICTRDEFAGIDADVSEEGEPIVVGRRNGGETVMMSQMSDGTRDQLFLAFRLASIGHYAENAEPLPLIADDILVHFDDQRGQATLELLAELGRKTQVLLFTHHESVVLAARSIEAAGRATVIDLRDNHIRAPN